MKYSLHDYLGVALASLSPSLASIETRAHMASVARQLPPTAAFGFETRLRSAEATLDLFARIRAVDGSRRAFAGLNRLVAIPDKLLTSDAWRQLRAFCRRWHDDGDSLHAAIDDMWLEIDAAVYDSARPIPCIFFHLLDRGERAVSVATAGCRMLFGAPGFELDPLTRRCLAAGVGRGWVEHVGLMLSRPDRPLRLIIVGMCAEDVVPALEELGWRGDYARLSQLHARLTDLVRGYTLAIDVGVGGVLPRIGIECYLGNDGTNDPHTIAAFVERCVALDLALPAKSAALSRWPGISSAARFDGEWPANLTAAQARFGLRSVFARQLNHFKLVYADDQPAEVKAYFGLSHLWLHSQRGDHRESRIRS
jgi:hypothetical protein